MLNQLGKGFGGEKTLRAKLEVEFPLLGAADKAAGAIAGLEDMHGDAAFAQKMRAREAGDSGADHEDRWRSRHVGSRAQSVFENSGRAFTAAVPGTGRKSLRRCE